MPIYEYRCADCGHELEVMQKVSEPALTRCPSCGKAALKKLISAAGFQLKGSGWYATDFKNSGKKEGTTPPSAEKSENGGETKTKKAAGCGHGSCGCAS